MYKKILAVMAVCMGIGSGALYAQVDAANASHNLKITLAPLMLVDIEGGNSIELKLADVLSSEAGAAFSVTALKNTSLYLNYSSIVDGSTFHRIFVRLNQTKAQNGLKLKLRLRTAANVSNANGGYETNQSTNQGVLNGAMGNIGEIVPDAYAGPIGGSVMAEGLGVELLNTTDVLLVNRIGSCYTGNGVGYGYILEYFIEFTQIGQLDASMDENFTVTYTMTDL